MKFWRKATAFPAVDYITSAWWRLQIELRRTSGDTRSAGGDRLCQKRTGQAVSWRYLMWSALSWQRPHSLPTTLADDAWLLTVINMDVFAHRFHSHMNSWSTASRRHWVARRMSSQGSVHIGEINFSQMLSYASWLTSWRRHMWAWGVCINKASGNENVSFNGLMASPAVYNVRGTCESFQVHQCSKNV